MKVLKKGIISMRNEKLKQRRKRMRRRYSVGAAALAVVLVFVLALGLVTPVSAAETSADGDTRNDYSDSLGGDSSTRYAGRVWTDKSVSDENVSFSGDAGEIVVEKKAGEEFLVTYSALATSQAIEGKVQVPVDVVFVIDNSNSMDASVGDGAGKSRLEATVEAVNVSIKQIMSSNENSRVAVVIYGLEAETLLPLGHYAPMRDGNYITCDSQYTDGGWFGNDRYRTTFSAPDGNSVTMEPGERGTNTHLGVDAGMDILTGAQNIGEGVGKHVPALILLSDGAATSSGSGNWWEPSGTSGNGQSTANSYALKVAMNAAYQKQQVNKHYGVSADSDYACKVYTIGMGIEQLKDTGGRPDNTDYYRAQMALDPGQHLTDNNNVANSIEDAWDRYQRNQRPTLDGYTFNHPSTDDIDSIAYNDGYYSAENAEDVANVFDDITGSIVTARPSVPTEIEEGKDPVESGYITYTDPIGEYMAVKDVKTLIYSGVEFTQKDSSTEGNTTTYTFEGEIDSAVYGKHNVSEIEIYVQQTDATHQTLTVKIPASAIPLRVNTIDIATDGTAQNTSNGAYPIRLVYSVGAQEGVDLETLEGISNSYIEENADENGKIQFYSNLYSGNTQGTGSEAKTVGNATVEFTPSKENPFYFVQENTPLYLDEQLQQEARSYNSDATYYFEIQYYEGNSVKREAVGRAADLMDGYTEVIDGQLNLKAGSPRLGNLMDLRYSKDHSDKKENTTNTAETAYYPTFEGEPETGKFIVYLGNNGVLKANAPQSLTIEKKVTTSAGLAAPGADFTFDVTIENKADSTVKAILHETGKEDREQEVTFDQDGKATITLKTGQSLEIPNMAKDAEYTITETNLPDGFTSDKVDNTVSGTMGTEDKTETFTNTYSVTPITSEDLKLDLGGTKNMVGRDFQNGDSFEFTISAAQFTPDAPLPQKDGKTVTSVTVTPTSGEATEFKFDGTITFTKPGEYRYIIRETEGALAGVDYDPAIYRLDIVVTDNGDGTLRLATPDEIEELYPDSQVPYTANPYLEKWTDGTDFEKAEKIEFTNKYSATDAQVVLKGTKELKVENSEKKLADNDFTFKLEALGSNTDGSDSFTADSAQPMPNMTEVGNIANGNVQFGSMTFTQNMIGKTYGYKITEVVPEGVDGENRLNGITYDTSEEIVKVTVTRSDEGGDEHVVATVTPNEKGNHFTFTNTYRPDEVIIGGTDDGMKVQKTFTGRTWKDGDEFEYTLTAANGAPLPEDTTVTIGKPASGEVNTAAFGNITFSKAGSYEYEIKETTGSLGGVTYDKHTAKVTVIVTEDPASGTLSAKVAYDNTGAETEADQNQKGCAAFTNTYKAAFDPSTAVNLTGKKILTGKELKDGAFYFEVSAQDGAPMGDSLNLNPNKGESIQLLSNISYEKAGDYVYLIKEQIPEPRAKGMVYDESVYRVMVSVKDDGEGHLTASAPKIEKRAKGSQSYEAADEVVFENSYAPLKTALATQKLTKKLTGDRSGALKAGEFTFEMSVVSADPQDGISLPDPAVVKNAADGSVSFGDITFTKTGTYKVQVKETVPEDADKVPGVVYDEHAIVTTFSVNDVDGQLVATRTGTTGSSTFTNEYKTSGTLDGKTSLEVTKVLTGRDWKQGDKFTFTLAAGDADTENAVAKKTVVLPETKNIYITDETEGYKASFGDITFNAAGTYTFTVQEVKPETGALSGISYDTEPRTITVKAEDKGDGTLDVQVVTENSDKLTFINTYSPGTIDLDGASNLEVTKEITGRDWQNGDAFTFTLEADPNDKTTQDALNAKKITLPDNAKKLEITDQTTEHKASFGNITFTKEGTYKFIVRENIPADADKLGGITYDTAVKHIIINVTDNKDGTLTAEKAENSETLDFRNTYTPEEVTIGNDTNAGIAVQKTLNGRAGDEKWLETDRFHFTIKNTAKPDGVENAPMPEPAELTIEKPESGKVNMADFGEMTFNKAGTYQYEIVETKGDIPGVSYDGHTALVTVEVEDNTKTGKLEAKVSYDNSQAADTDKDESKVAAFTNAYDPDPAVIGSGEIAGISVKKTFTGRAWDRDTDTFNFRIENVKVPEGTEIAPIPENEEVAIGKPESGEVNTGVFGEMSFDAPGDYIYTIDEADGTIGGVKYDKHKATVTVRVTDNAKIGKLEAELLYDNSSASTESDKAEMETAAFTNTYEASGTVDVPGTDLTLTKKLIGKTWNEDTFKFVITGKSAPEGVDPIPMPEQTEVTVDKATDADNNIANFGFGKITFHAPGEYLYEVREQEGDNQGITYSKNVAEIKVTVTDNLNGGYTATVEKSNTVFENNYHAELDYMAKGGLDLTKNLTGRDLEKGQFEFTVTPKDDSSAEKAGIEGAKVIQTDAASMNAEGISSATMPVFSAMKFNADDAGKTYRYTIEETKKGGAGYTNDDTVYTVEISTEDDGAGVLTVTTTVSGTDGTDKSFTYSSKDAPKETAEVVFDNAYDAEAVLGGEGTVSLKASKTLDGRDLEKGEFQFQVLNNQGTVIAKGSNAAAGDGKATDVTFDAIEYNIDRMNKDVAEGIADRNGSVYTYQYTLAEVTDGLTKDGISGVATKFAVTVTVMDNGDGTLGIDVAYPDGGAAFENAYGKDAKAEIQLSGTKRIVVKSGDHAPTPTDIEGKYTFTLTGSEGAPMPDKTEAKNDASGTIDFGKITYTMKNVFGAEASSADGESAEKAKSSPRTRTFTYTIRENGSVAGITNDGAQTVKVTVTDNGDGTLSVQPDGTADFTFENTYSVAPSGETSPTDGAVAITKTLDGRDLKKGEFDFVMTDKNGKEATRGTNRADGTVVLGGISFEKPGTYEYTISESAGTQGGMTYDGTRYKAIATVSDQGDGTLNVKWSVSDADGKTIERITFHNIYQASATGVQLAAVKKLDGRELQEGEFTFVLKDKDGEVIAKAQNDENGAVTFEELSFKQAGTYAYTMEEVAGEDGQITYDDTAYPVTITVKDSQKGYLTASVDYGKKTPVFTNVYEAEKDASAQTGDNRPILPMLIVMTAALLAMAVIAMNGLRRRQK